MKTYMYILNWNVTGILTKLETNETAVEHLQNMLANTTLLFETNRNIPSTVVSSQQNSDKANY